MNPRRLMFLGLILGILAMVSSVYASDRYTIRNDTQCGPGGQCGPAVVSTRPNTEFEEREIAGMATPLPSDAKPGECFARVFIPAKYETKTEQVLVREASERVEIIPAKYEVVDERVMVRGPSKRLEEVSAKFEWRDEQVLVEEAHQEWRPGRGAIEKMDFATGEVMCLVEVPASFKTVRKQVLVSPATVREVEVPAEYQMIKVTKMTEPPQEKHIQLPAEYQTVTRTIKVSDGHMAWQKVECEIK